MTAIILFIFGAIVGSFLNVIGLRYNSGLSLGGRSSCPSCGKKLRPKELLPILSYIFFRGRCSGCRVNISLQYPAVEILTGLVFATVFNLPFPIFNKLILLLVFCIYIVILIYDFRHKIIPDMLVYSAILLSVVGRWLFGGAMLDWLAGPVISVFFAVIWLLSRGRAIGFGDAKLGLSLGLLLGAANGFSGIILAFWIGAAYGIFAMIFSSKKLTMKSEVPFAPFLILGGWVALIFNLDLMLLG